MQGYIQGHHKQMLMWGKGWITELSIDLFIWRPRLEIFFYQTALSKQTLWQSLQKSGVIFERKSINWKNSKSYM